ncbi:Fc.00g084390.m01.CDS01 [Cosmosporella sp. VM-42]
MPAIYPYKSLNQKAKEIRILRFDLQDFTSDKLICSIEHVSLLDKDVVPYVAASYTWGKATSRNMINIDGIEVSIPENSNIALRNLSSLRSKRHHYPGTSETTIVDSLAGGCRVWMDAICINQNDLEERTQQVSLMGDIYTKASAVLIWLGEDPQGLAGAAFETICQIQRTGEPFIAAVTRQGDGLGRHMWMPDQKSLPIPINWSSLQSLFSAPWFERVWTIQEAILNKQTFAVFGDHLCAYSHVHMVSLFLVKKHNYELVLKGRMPGLDLAATRESFAGINDAKKNSPENLTGMLSSLHLFSATENKDRIFSFMGIIDKRVRSIILPSYNYTLAEVYARATVASITVNGLLTAFTYAANSLKPDGGKEADDNLPSWAIKCHWKWTSNVLPIRIFSRRPVEECRYDFSELPGRVASTGWRVLPLQGVIIDEIVDTSPVITPEIINDDKAMVRCL